MGLRIIRVSKECSLFMPILKDPKDITNSGSGSIYILSVNVTGSGSIYARFNLTNRSCKIFTISLWNRFHSYEKRLCTKWGRGNENAVRCFTLCCANACSENHRESPGPRSGRSNDAGVLAPFFMGEDSLRSGRLGLQFLLEDLRIFSYLLLHRRIWSASCHCWDDDAVHPRR